MKFKPYHKIKQLKDVVQAVTHSANFKGLDENNNPIYEETEKPIIKFIGTVKLHGTNAGVCYDPETGITPQKRSSLLSDLTSHFNFPAFVKTNEEYLKDKFEKLYRFYQIPSDWQMTIYGEWAGKGIQKAVGIAELEKAFYIFDCKIFNKATEEEKWVDISLFDFEHDKIHNIYRFKTFEMDIDFNNPGLAQNKLIEITEAVEKECPVAKHFGISGIGEGVVWTGFWRDNKYIFKVKGEKHSTTKVKKLASVDVETLNSINEFVEYACTQNRMDQGIQETGATEKKHMPNLLRWVAKDIISEEGDTLEKNNLEWKQVAKQVNDRVRRYYFLTLEKV